MDKWSLDLHIPPFLIRSSSYYVVLTDLGGLYQVANTCFHARFGYDPTRLKGVHSFELIHPEDHAAAAAAVQACLESPDQPVQVLLRKPDAQSYFWSSWEFSALAHEGEPWGVLCVGHDVTAEQIASIRVHQYAKAIDDILEEMTDGFIQFDKYWNFTKINLSAGRIASVVPEEYIGKCLWDVIPSNSQLTFINKFKLAISSNQRIEFEEYFPLADRSFSFLIHPAEEGLTVFFRETSEDVRRRNIVLDSQQKLQALLNSTQDSNVYFNRDFCVLTVNERARQESFLILGKTIQINDDLREFLEPTFYDTFIEASQNSLQGDVVEFDVCIGGIWFNFRFYPVKNDVGVITGVALNARNIHQNKEAALRIQEQEAILRAIYNSTTEASTFLDLDFIIRFNNQTSREITLEVIGREASVGDNALDFILPEDQDEFFEYYHQVFQGERVILEKYAGGKWWKFYLNPVYDNENVEVIGISQVVKDISEAKSHVAKILQQNQILKEISWKQSHELRRPVATILGVLDLVRYDKTEMTPLLAKYCDFLVTAAKDLDDMTTSIVEQVNNIK